MRRDAAWASIQALRETGAVGEFADDTRFRGARSNRRRVQVRRRGWVGPCIAVGSQRPMLPAHFEGEEISTIGISGMPSIHFSLLLGTWLSPPPSFADGEKIDPHVSPR